MDSCCLSLVCGLQQPSCLQASGFLFLVIMEALLKKRRSIISQVKQLEGSIERSEGLTQEYLFEYHAQVVVIRKEHVDLHELISIKSSDEAYEQHEQQFFDLCERINKIKTTLDGMISRNTEGSMLNSTMLIPGSQVRVPSDVRLPRLDLPVFDGDIYQWVSFHDLFKSVVHDNFSLTGAQKLQYLKASLKGEPSLLVQSIPISNANFAEAWGLLIARYDCRREIIRAQLERLVVQPAITSESPVALRKLIDTTTECVRSLEVLKLSKEELFELMVIHIVSKKLDSESRLQWERSLDDVKLPSLENFVKFLDHHARVTAVVAVKSSMKPQPILRKLNPVARNDVSVHQSALKQVCDVCKGDHLVFKCDTFLKLSIQQRIEEIMRLRLCFNCLRRGHGAQQCSSGHCRKCQKPHHTLIHREAVTQPAAEPEEVVVASQVVANRIWPQVLLATALIRVQDSRGSSMVCRAFLDNGSQGSFITERCAQKLQLPRHRLNVKVSGLASVGVECVRSSVPLVFSSLYNQDRFETTALVLSKISNLLPSCPIKMDKWPHLEGLRLADPQFFQPGPVDVLLGADIFSTLMCFGRSVFYPGFPSAVESVLGWIVMGSIPTKQEESIPCHQIIVHHVQVDAEALLQKFWEVEDVPQASTLTEEEKQCEDYFVSTVSRDAEGRFQVCLPFRSGTKKLGSSRDIALRRFHQVERRLTLNSELKSEYVSFMEEYEKLGHMSLVPQQKLDLLQEKMCYLPHHAVFKQDSSTTKMRVVFDASAKSSTGVSLNDLLMVGPKLQEDLFGLLTRFRTHLVAFTADIEKMYRQVLVNPSDVNFQRILWRKSPGLPIGDYRLNTVTYGTAPAPYLAVRSLQELAVQNQPRWPGAAAVVMNDFYMDDLMSGAPSVERALILQEQLVELLADGGFQLRKWASNEPAIVQAVEASFRGTQTAMCISEDNSIKILGIHWHPAQDYFSFMFQDLGNPYPDLTKRRVLSALARVYDPLGWLSPVTIVAKVMFQEIWKTTVDWDTPLPEEICEKWSTYNTNLKMIEALRIQRCVVFSEAYTYRLCGFCDASESAYAAVVYLVSGSLEGASQVKLLVAKTRVAPVKSLSLPRLELCAAVLLVKLMSSVSKVIQLKLQSSCCWSDSTIVLSWLASPSYRWKTFVANRVSLIQEFQYTWSHVTSAENPADCASRGISSSELLYHPLWWTGPRWLQQYLVKEPVVMVPECTGMTPEEKNPVMCKIGCIDTSLFEKFSSLSTLQRVVAFCRRFIDNSRKSVTRQTGFLTVQELESALLLLVKLAQQQEFHQEIECVVKGKSLPSKSSLLSLNPFCDEAGLLRVGGRLRSSALPFENKHPLILPRKCQLTTMVVQREHLRQLHAGPQLLLATLQLKFWIPCGRDVVRRVVRKCVVCHKQRASTSSQMMGDLPAARVLPSPGAFVCAGVDFAGPLTLRVMKGRGCKRFKGYIAIFVCFVTRAVHLELVSDLTAEAFIASLRRFVSRRGKPANMYSDCGTNFTGASKILDDSMKIVKMCQAELVHRYLSEEKIQWHFNPPGAPHFGGLWEAGVKSTKYHLRRVVGDVVLNFEEVTTLLAQIEACLNSRPLTQLSGDPNDLLPLTPGHFLVGRALSAIPEPDFSNVTENRLSRWHLLQKLTQDFWKRWSTEYLSRLQQRPKWWKKTEALKIGDLVLVKEERLAPMQWRLGRILELHPGKDKLVRVVTLKTSSGVFRRPVVKISPLPLECDIES